MNILDFRPVQSDVDIARCGAEPSLRELVHFYYVNTASAILALDKATEYARIYCEQIEAKFKD